MRLGAANRLTITASRGSITLEPAVPDPAGFVAFGGNRVDVVARGALGTIRVARSRVGGRRITIDSAAATTPAGPKAVTLTGGSLLTSDPMVTKLVGSAGDVTIRGTRGTAPAGSPAVIVTGMAALDSGRNLAIVTRQPGDAACLGGAARIEANGGQGTIYLAGVRDVVRHDGTAVIRGKLEGGNKLVAGPCP